MFQACASARAGSAARFGATAIVFDEAVVAAVDMRGGAPGTRETDLLGPATLVERIDAIALSGGSAFGLDAASGIQAWLREQGRGFAVGAARIPIVPGAILFDLHVGGDKGWGRYPPYRELGYEAAAAADSLFALGSAGAGLGARTVNLKGGTGSASAMCDGFTIGALAAVNAVGSVVVGDGPGSGRRRSSRASEFGGRGFPSPMPRGALDPHTKGTIHANTTLVVVATDAALTRPQATRLAIMAQDGIGARDLSSSHPARRRHRVRGSDRRPAACRSGARSHANRHFRGAGGGARHRAGRVRGDGPTRVRCGYPDGRPRGRPAASGVAGRLRGLKNSEKRPLGPVAHTGSSPPRPESATLKLSRLIRSGAERTRRKALRWPPGACAWW